MSPLIPDGTKLTIFSKKFSEIKLYDIVAVKTPRGIVIHQCLFKSKEYLICRGVNNNFVDPPVSPKQIIGIVHLERNWQVINLAYDYELNRLHRHLPDLPIMILKGGNWQKRQYGYYFNKPVSDIDILITKKSYSKLKKTLIHFGYRPYYNHRQQKQRYRQLLVHEISFYKKISPQIVFNIDVHFLAIRPAFNRLFPHPISAESMQSLTDLFWEKSSSQNGFYFLQNEYLLLYYCLNCFFHHGLRSIDLLAQIANIVANEKIDWPNFWKISQEFHFTNFVYYPLGWSSRFFQISIPKINLHRPSLLRRLATKTLINHFTIFHQFSHLDHDWLSTQTNIRLISILRIILFKK